MTNWRNWREGDKLVCIQHYSEGDEPEQEILVSEVVEVARVECTDYEGALPVELHGHLYKGWVEVPGDDLTAYFRWHSRPTP